MGKLYWIMGCFSLTLVIGYVESAIPQSQLGRSSKGMSRRYILNMIWVLKKKTKFKAFITSFDSVTTFPKKFQRDFFCFSK